MRYTGAGIAQCWTTDWMIGGSSPDMGWEFFSSPLRPVRLWGLQSLLLNGYKVFIP